MRIPNAASLKPVVRGMCGAASAGGLVSSIIRGIRKSVGAGAVYPELSLFSFLPSLPDGDYPQTKLDSMCGDNKSLFVFAETALLMCPPQLFCPKESTDDKPSFRASFWTIPFTPTEAATLDKETFAEFVQVFIGALKSSPFLWLVDS